MTISYSSRNIPSNVHSAVDLLPSEVGTSHRSSSVLVIGQLSSWIDLFAGSMNAAWRSSVRAGSVGGMHVPAAAAPDLLTHVLVSILIHYVPKEQHSDRGP